MTKPRGLKSVIRSIEAKSLANGNLMVEVAWKAPAGVLDRLALADWATKVLRKALAKGGK